jgi:hypothetical protein
MQQPVWRKWLRIFGIIILILTALLYLIIGLSEPNGKAYRYDNQHTIYYSADHLDVRLIKSIGDSLTKIGLFTPQSRMDVQVLFKPEQGDTIYMGYIVQPDKLTDETRAAFRDITQYLYPLFRCEVKILFKDAKFRLIEEMKLN